MWGGKHSLGKPYFVELEQLEETYAFAMEMDIRRLIKAVSASIFLPLLVVGSGGSLTVARLIVSLHQRFARMIAKPVTPLELFENSQMAPKTAIWFMSAGGRNADIQAAIRSAIFDEPQRLLVTCARTSSPLATFARKYNYTDIFEFDLPSKRDGFLATNSLLAFSVLFVRAYLDTLDNPGKLPPDFRRLMGLESSHDRFLSELRQQCHPLWDRENLVVLYGNQTEAAAYDLESKFTEAALGPVQISDFRNFAHGRHHWLAKRREISGVIALTTVKDRRLAQKTLSLLPQGIPVVEFHFPGEHFVASIQAIVTMLHIVGLAGEVREIDPGRPGVPEFGRRIYNLRMSTHMEAYLPKDTKTVTLAEQRKLNALPGSCYKQGQAGSLRQACQSFTKQLKGVCFSGIVFDYDGTLCDNRQRFEDLNEHIAKELLRLLGSGLMIGIATGRGKSVKMALRKAIPSAYWERILVGCYNGGDCALLSEDNHPDGTDATCPELTQIEDALKADPRVHKLFEVTIRRPQITIEPRSVIPIPTLWSLANEIVHKYGPSGATVLTSGHSVDILAPGVTKRNIGRMLSTIHHSSPDARILCIGDKGRWPGNDFDLLSEPFSLSVDEVSSDPLTCWNLAPAGYRGIQATLYYLDHMRITAKGLLLKLPASKEASS
jgi:hypothetical protein